MELRTKNGHNMFDVSSMVQKSLRRGLVNDALYAANEMIPKYRSYLWKRLLTVSAEDCFGFMTSKIAALRLADKATDETDRRYIATAVCILANAKKNRDADYFACNLLNSRDKMTLKEIEPTLSDACSKQYPTKNGHGMFDVSAAFVHSVTHADYIGAGYTATELFTRYRKFFWKTVHKICNSIENDKLKDEIEALNAVDMEQCEEKNATAIYIAKAVVLITKASTDKSIVFEDVPNYQLLDISWFDDKFYTIPNYVYDCHTMIGKRKGKTKEMFVVEEQKALYPLEKGVFDDSSWERFFELCKIGFFVKDAIVPAPDKERMSELNEGSVQLSLW